MSEEQRTTFTVSETEGRTVIAPRGDWLARTLDRVEAQVREFEAGVDPASVTIDLSGVAKIDTAGAYLLGRVLKTAPDPDADVHFSGEHPTARRLIALTQTVAAPKAERERSFLGLYQLFDRAGRGLETMGRDVVGSLAFFGETLAAAGRGIAQPHKIRWAAAFHVMEQAGVNALPIIGTLSFFLGAVVAYIGANLLSQFGASVFAVELVGFAILREFAVVITAILLAGRSDSAFTAQIGSMRMQQEIDAMRVLGLDPFDALVLPRVIACLVMAPVLAFAAVCTGLLGGMMVLWSSLGITPGFFIARMQDTITVSHLWVGLSKAPVFAIVIAVIGCRQGLTVGNDVESLGHNVTSSVVQSIFAVIVIDALFAMAYLELDI
ncbi:MAG: MlaE family lipid ABC transporter permease subunit [Maricaulaceae bacterium]|jgi:phospholipid/cholesterol/gamma-HCH transport system permease protein